MQKRFMSKPAVAVVSTVAFGIVALALLPRALDAAEQLAAGDDPVKIADYALKHALNRDVAERGIRAALADGDVNLAQSFVTLAAEKNVPVDSDLIDQVKKAGADHDSASGTTARFVQGFWTGEPVDVTSFAGTALSDLFVFGDIRDLAREGSRYITGQHYDPWVLGLAGVGIGVTAATYVTSGAGAPERIGLSLIKGARRTDHLNPALVTRITRDIVKAGDAKGVIELAGSTGRIEATAGTEAALDSLTLAQEPKDLSRLARLASAKGTSTRAILKLLGPAAYLLVASAFGLTMWIFSAVFAVFGLFASLKATVEHIARRCFWRRKANA